METRLGAVLLAIMIALASAAPARAATPLTVAGTQQFDLVSSANDRAYRIFVAIPDRAPPAGGYGVLYVMDANAMFLTALETVRARERRPDVPDDLATVVVGIGYPDGVDVAVERTYDLTPGGSASPRIQARSGGADAFLAFVERELKPKIAALADVDPDRQGIFGHSFGGLFVLHALASSPDAFQTYMAASPSLWFAPSVRDALATEVDSTDAADAPRLLVTAGEFEQVPSPSMRAQPNAERMMAVLRDRGQVDSARGIVALVAKAGAADARFDEIPGEDHGSVIPAAIARAVRFMLSEPLPVPAVPGGADYLALSPEARYALRLRVRDLPDAVRIPWLNRLKATLHAELSAAQREALHAERNRMDDANGTRPHAVNADR